MSNLIAMMVNVRMKGESAIVGSKSHINLVERGGMAAIGSIHPVVVSNNDDGTMDLDQLEYSVPPVSVNLPQPRLIALESPHNLCNGRVLKPEYFSKVKQIANKHKLKMHIDASRGLNAAAALNIDPAEMVKDFDTVNFCLGKGLAGPIGSVLLGNKEDIEQASIVRKLLGGTMRKTGLLASCILVSLKDWREKLTIDNENARWLAQELSTLKQIIIDPYEVETNMFRFQLN